VFVGVLESNGPFTFTYSDTSSCHDKGVGVHVADGARARILLKYACAADPSHSASP
jgi:hypothetical protein